MIDKSILDKHKIDKLLHGDDNSNVIDKNRLEIIKRTKKVLAVPLLEKAASSITQIKNKKLNANASSKGNSS